jgi:restriction system protein
MRAVISLGAVAGVAAALTVRAGGSDPTTCVVIGIVVGVLGPAVLVAAPRFLVGIVRGARTVDPREHPAADKHDMSGTDFEDHVARIARTCGVPVIMTPLSGDWGVDLIVGTRPRRLAIQCKRQSRPVGTGAVQEVVAGAPMQDCSQTMVVTNNDFTPAARRLAERHDCVLVGGADLPRLASTIRSLTVPDRRQRI